MREQRLEELLKELSMLELLNGRLLDDDSIGLIAELRCDGILGDDEWLRAKQYLLDALKFLSGPQGTMSRDLQGRLVVNPDFDPRNADWLRSDAACRLAGHLLPSWAALWLWRLRTDTSPHFWKRVGRVAERLGYPRFPAEEQGRHVSRL